MPFNPDSTQFGADEDVLERTESVGLMAASQDATKQAALIARKGKLGRDLLISDLLTKIAKAMQPLGSYPGGVLSSSLNSPDDVLKTWTNPERMGQAWVVYVICAMLEEGEVRLRFKYEDAGEAIGKMISRWEKKKLDAFESSWPLCAFDLNGDGQLTYVERGFTNKLSSVRVTC